MYALVILFLLHLYVVTALEALSSADILARPISLIYFYRPDCRFCEELSPTIDHLLNLYNHNQDFQIVKVNGRARQDLVKLFLVQAYPTLKLYDDSKKLVTSYSGKRLVELLEQFILENSQATPNWLNSASLVVSINGKSDLDHHLAKNPVLIAFVDSSRPEWRQSRYSFHFYHGLARENPDIVFATTSITEVSSELLQYFKVSNSPSLVYYDGQKIGTYRTLETDSEQALDESDIKSFIDSIPESQVERIGSWFSNSHDLNRHADSIKSKFVQGIMPGMNYIASSEKDFSDDIESQYDELLQKVFL